MKKYIVLLVVSLTVSAFAQKQNGKKGDLKMGVIHELYSKALGEKRILNVYLPNGYEKGTESYPVIYLLDGSENEDLHHITGIVQFLTMIEKMPQSIVIGIANVDRKRDFTFPTTIEQDKKDFPTTGSSAKFIQFVESELQPYVVKNFRTTNNRTIIGQSLGGLVATEILLEKPTLFNNYVIVSPSLWWDNESLLQKLPALEAKKPIAQVYISVGSEGKQMEGDARQLAELLGNKEQFPTLKTIFVPLPQETHLTILHNAVYKGLQALNEK